MNKFITLFATHTNKITTDTALVTEIISESTKLCDIEYVHIKQRIWHLAHNLISTPICPVCTINAVNWDKVNTKYTQTCGRKCATSHMSNSVNVREKTASTNLLKYGSIAPAGNRAVLQKAVDTKVEKYGAHNGSVWKDKIQAGVLVKYGVTNVSTISRVNDKKTETWKEKSLSDISDIVGKRKLTFFSRYGVTNASNILTFKRKATNTNVLKYGVMCPASSSFNQAITTANNMNKYGRKSHTQKHISEQAMLCRADRQWLLTAHHDHKRTLTSISQELHLGTGELIIILDSFDIQILRFASSQAERDIADFLTKHNVVFTQNDRTVIAPLELDFHVPSHNLAIEYCGLYWHSNKHERIDNQYHARKQKLCASTGVRLITIFEDEWTENKQLVLDKIQHILQLSTTHKVYARKTTVGRVSTSDKREFFNKYHIQGDGPSSTNLGLFDHGILVAVMGFITSAPQVYTLNRYATSTQVVGGFSKLLKTFASQHSPSEIVSFADLRWSEGALYESNQFTLDKVLPPDYYWVVNGQREHKFNWRHSAKLRLLPNYDSALSESQNMYNHKYYKIFNCGLQRWVIKYT